LEKLGFDPISWLILGLIIIHVPFLFALVVWFLFLPRFSICLDWYA